MEPAVSTANMIRNTFLTAPITWAWNRNIYQLPSNTVKGTQDYTIPLTALPDFGFLEKVDLLDVATGKHWEIVDVYNNWPMSYATDTQQPKAACIFMQTSTNIILRFVGVPNAPYTVTLIYQKRAIMFGPYSLIEAVPGSGDTLYTGTFDPLAFPPNSIAQITGFTNAGNNGSFIVLSCTPTLLTVSSNTGVFELNTGYASNFDWAPIPDWYQDVYNNLFLSEMFTNADDARGQQYRQRGIAAFLAKAEGLTEMQKKAFVQQWLARSVEMMTSTQMAQMGNQLRAV